MLRPLYPPGHKKAGTVKADKDLTPEEVARQQDQLLLKRERDVPVERDAKLREFADSL